MANQKNAGHETALREITQRVRTEGYGFCLSHLELNGLLGIKEPAVFASGKEWNAYQFARLDLIEALKDELLYEHKLCLHNARREGYQVLHPNEQIGRAVDRRKKALRKAHGQMADTLIHVRTDELTVEMKEKRIKELQRCAFISTELNRRKFQQGVARKDRKGRQPDSITPFTAGRDSGVAAHV